MRLSKLLYVRLEEPENTIRSWNSAPGIYTGELVLVLGRHLYTVFTAVSFTMTRWKQVKRISQDPMEGLNLERTWLQEEIYELPHTVRGYSAPRRPSVPRELGKPEASQSKRLEVLRKRNQYTSPD